MLYQFQVMDSPFSVTPADLLATISKAEPLTHILFQAVVGIICMTVCR